MTAHIIYYLIVAFILLGFFLNRYLAWLNVRNWKEEIPDELKDYYNEEKFTQARLYQKENNRFALISSSFSLIITLSFLAFNGFAFVDDIVRNYSEHRIVLPLLFFGILFIASDIITLPFDVYHTFVIEEKFGFNKTTVKTFIIDKIKSYVMAVILGGSLLSVFVWFYYFFGDHFWIAAWVLIGAVSVFFSMFYTSLIVPIFNKLKPLEEGDLKNSIEEFCQKVEYRLSNLFVIDGSKRSAKSNAYFSGFGPKKTIVLFDTLIEQQETPELVAVLAHEIGHYKLKHTKQSLIISLLQTGLTLYILSLVIDEALLGKAFGVGEMSLHIGLLAFSFLYSPVSLIMGIFMNILSRKNEYEADAYAAKHHSGKDLITALKKLSVDNLSNPYPHPTYVFFHHSHPPLLDRIAAIRDSGTI
jgi:STE24 endopeptidase